MESGAVGAPLTTDAAHPLLQLLFYPPESEPELEGKPIPLQWLVREWDESPPQDMWHDVCRTCTDLAMKSGATALHPLSPEGYRAVGRALARSLRNLTTLGLTDLDAVDLGPLGLAGELRSARSRAVADLSDDEARVHDALLGGCCLHVLDHLVQRSDYVQRMRPEQTGELSRLVEEAEQLGPQGFAKFEERYAKAVADLYGHLTLSGADLPGVPRAWPLDVYQPLTAAGTSTRATRENAQTLLSRYTKVCLRGEAGSGKSTLVRYLAVTAARGEPVPDDLEYLRDRVPFVLSLRSMAPDTALAGPEEWAARTASAVGGEQPPGWATEVLRSRRGLILIDGVDEVLEDVRRLVAPWITAIDRAHPGNLWLLTTRPSAVPDEWLSSDGFVDRTLLPLDTDGTRALAHALQDAADSAHASPTSLQKLVDRLLNYPDLAKLVTNPLLCTFICVMLGQGDRSDRALPVTRSELYQALMDVLLSRRDKERGVGVRQGDSLSTPEQMAFLKRLAHNQLINEPLGSPMQTTHALRLISSVLSSMPQVDADSRDVLRNLITRSGVLTATGEDTLTFSHVTLRDWLAAQEIVEREELGLLATRALDGEWQDVIRYAVAEGRPAERARILTSLIDLGDRQTDVENRTRLYALAAAALENATSVDPQVRETVLERLSSILPPDTDAQARALAVLGEAVFALLPEPHELTTRQAAVVTAMAHRIGGRASEEAVQRFAVRIAPAAPPAAPGPGAAAAPAPAGMPEPAGGAYDLAVALSVATRIEPEVLRAVRLGVFRQLDAGHEADLWFGPWVSARTRGAIALRPDFLPHLRAELARRISRSQQGDAIRTIGPLIADAHRRLSPALALEERINWIDVSGGAGRKEAMEEALRPALRALITEERDGIADWLSGAWARLPETARSTVTGWQLVTSAMRRVPDAGLPPVTAPDSLRNGDVAVLVDLLPDVALPVSRDNGVLRLGSALDAPDVATILVPDTHPRVVDVLVEDEAGRAITVRAGETRTVVVGDARVRLRTARGAIYDLTPGTSAATTEQGTLPAHSRTDPGHCLLRGSAAATADMARVGSLVRELSEYYVMAHGRAPARSQTLAWERELPRLAQLLVDAGLEQTELLLEYALPGTTVRVDAVVAGLHPVTADPSYVIVELKGWTSAVVAEDDPRLCRPDGFTRTRLHPVEQVRGHCEYLVSRHALLRDRPSAVSGMACLLDATDTAVGELFDLPHDSWGRLYTAEGRGAAQSFLRSVLSPAPGSTAADELLASAGRHPDSTALVTPDPARHLLDEQRIAYETVLGLVERARRADHKEVIVVSGGPGSGKTSLALSLLCELDRRRQSVRHVSGSRAFVAALRERAPDMGLNKEMFTYFNSFVTAEHNGLDVLICDEAQHIRRTSASRFMTREVRESLDRTQTEELIDAARVPVFLLDELQAVSPEDVGTRALIEEAARKRSLKLRQVDLTAQFRFGGSPYMDWVTALLDPSQREQTWQPDSRYTLLTVDTPQDMEWFLGARIREGMTARITAGQCWPMSTPRGDSALGLDVVIGDWRRPWQSGSGRRSISGEPPLESWTTDPSGFEQIGHVYGVQGLEFDWCGVIIGPDLVWREGEWRVIPSASHFPGMRSGKRDDETTSRLVLNAYRVLLSRGRRGTVVHSTDTETRDRLRHLLPVWNGEDRDPLDDEGRTNARPSG
ncbi:DNA/RNA helicase domain-containing protein [Streptomyces sviceus]|uniref:DNA/RNA helicase domain-containing protein n=1 Tax=Streptomyces sviceus TaxID=285530 RepID=UPI003826F589